LLTKFGLFNFPLTNVHSFRSLPQNCKQIGFTELPWQYAGPLMAAHRCSLPASSGRPSWPPIPNRALFQGLCSRNPPFPPLGGWLDGRSGASLSGMVNPPRPAFIADKLPVTRTGASAAFRSQAAARLRVKPLCQLSLFANLQQVISQGEHQPERTHQLDRFDEAHS